MRHIISLTAVPPRFAMLGPALASLVAQKQRAESIRLYIPLTYRRFAGYAGEVPAVPDGVTIVRVADDLGPATKVLYAARDLRGQAVDIVYGDDDHHYLPDWTQRLLAARAAHPDCAVAACGTSVALLGRPDYAPKPQPQAVKPPSMRHQLGFQVKRLLMGIPHGGRAHLPMNPPFRCIKESGFADVAEGFAGVAISPDFLDDAVFDIPPHLAMVDDIWLSGHLARRGIGIWAEAGANRFCTLRAASSTDALHLQRAEGTQRLEANRACIDHMRREYGVWC